jgi:hypothetical protein
VAVIFHHLVPKVSAALWERSSAGETLSPLQRTTTLIATLLSPARHRNRVSPRRSVPKALR